MSKLFFDEQPIVISRELAKIVGLNEAIVLQQIHYWIEINRKANKNFYEGRYWTYNSIRAWHEDNFDFWSLNTVQRTFSKLENQGLLISGNFNKDPRDKTKWYSIDENAVEKLKKTITPNWGNEKKTVFAKVTNDFPITPIWGNALDQNGVMQCSNLGQALPEITTEITTEISKSVSQSKKKSKKENQPAPTQDGQTDFQQIEHFLRDKLNFTDLEVVHDKKILDEIWLNLLEMYHSDYTIIHGQNKPRELIRSAIMRLSYWHIDELINKYKSITAKIINPKAYMQSMIYNIAFENDLAVTNAVNHDMHF